MFDLPLVIANFKANKKWPEVSDWIEEVGIAAQKFPGTIVVAPSIAFTSETCRKIKRESLKLKVAAQDISKFEQGAYTGEVAASQLKDQVDYAIIGHSERRQNFGEDDEVLAQKVALAKKAGIEPIYCVQGQDTPIPGGVEVVAYEPIAAIGTGNPDDPNNAQQVARAIKSKGEYTVLYGGSVNGGNVKNFVKDDMVGVLVGTASLDPRSFLKIVDTL